MYPGFFGWWKHAHAHAHAHAPAPHRGEGPCHHGGEARSCGPRGCGPGGGGPFRDHEPPGGGDGEGSPFGVRRPLRFLAWKLELEEPQIASLAQILDELKTERAQASVDQRRTVAAFADLVSAATFDEARAKEVADQRAKSAAQVAAAVAKALAAIHAVLDEEQRKRLAYLLRTGALAV